MRQGTTPRNIFKLPFSVDELEKVRLTYKQGDFEITREKESLTLESNRIVDRLTQDETLQFDLEKPVMIQLKFKFTTGDVGASRIFTKTVLEMIDKDVI